jgi:hypothetical protein
MLATLLSMLGGGFMRLLPEILGLLNKRTDNQHELAMLDKQFALEQTRGQMKLQEVQVTGDINQVLGLLDAQKEALAGQMQKIGVWWADALNFLVRPLTTYFFLLMYGAVKVATLVVALSGTDPWHAILQCWSEDDRAILSGILAFWFVGRVFDKKK